MLSYKHYFNMLHIVCIELLNRFFLSLFLLTQRFVWLFLYPFYLNNFPFYAKYFSSSVSQVQQSGVKWCTGSMCDAIVLWRNSTRRSLYLHKPFLILICIKQNRWQQRFVSQISKTSSSWFKLHSGHSPSQWSYAWVQQRRSTNC